jgi:late competence protein required for DNA uptake (superfamily II DNA/RNA helicase)
LLHTFSAKEGKTMSKNRKIRCQCCGNEISDQESYVVDGLTICDDCYLERSHRVKTCNPLATYSAKQFQKSDGLDAEKRLNHKQKAIYTYVKSKGKVTPKEISNKFTLSQTETENQLAILRHLELTKAKKEENKIYIIPF